MKTKRFLQIVLRLKYTGMILTIGSFLLIPLLSNGQNIGIGTDNPTEKLEVAGKVFSSEEGFKFPDGSVQTRAYNAYEAQDAGDNRYVIAMDVVNPPIPGSFDFDTLVNKIKVLDYQWGITVAPGGGGGGGTPVITNKTLKIIKNIDGSTNLLLQKAINGQYLNDVRLYFYRHLPNGGVQLYYKILMHQILVVAFDQHGIYIGGGDYSHLDIIEFQFQEATWIYQDGEFNNQVEYSEGPIMK